LLEWIEGESFWPGSPFFTDEVVGCEAFGDSCVVRSCRH